MNVLRYLRWQASARQPFGPFLVVISLALIAAQPAPAQAPIAPLYSIFNPGTNVQLHAHRGYSVALEGNIAVVGGFDAIGVRVYDFATGMLVHTLPTPPNSGERFGISVAISGTRVVVGAPWGNSTRAYVYDLSSPAPTVPVATLPSPTASFDDAFGWSVSISGTFVAIGQPTADRGAEDAGIAYVFNLASANPTLPITTLTHALNVYAGRNGLTAFSPPRQRERRRTSLLYACGILHEGGRLSGR